MQDVLDTAVLDAPPAKAAPAQTITERMLEEFSFVGRWKRKEFKDGLLWDSWLTLRPDGTWAQNGTIQVATKPQNFRRDGTWTREEGTLVCAIGKSTLPDSSGSFTIDIAALIGDSEGLVGLPDFSWRQEMVTLAYIAYAGTLGEKGGQPTVLLELINRFLEELEPVNGKWDVVWGPGLVNAGFTNLVDTNVFYVVRDRRDPTRYVIAIRGTNPLSIYSILNQVSAVNEQELWPVEDLPRRKWPRVSEGVANTLKHLKRVRAQKGVPGAGLTLVDFLKQEVAACQSPLAIHTTGHSLGGTMSATVAMWLRELQGCEGSLSTRWDPKARCTIHSTPIAGFSPGDKRFAQHFDSAIGGTCDRLYNSLDVVPHTYAAEDMNYAKSIYEPMIDAGFAFKAAIDMMELQFTLSNINYRQVRDDTSALEGTLEPSQREFMAQMLWQHIEGYLKILGLSDFINAEEILTASD
ncbi:hypothetical protein ABAZ39_27270 (plasmid) [Azospirillum argentinense]|uniref:Lipase family protein n=1 Tax=Azospirillum argentinense TaxID=2970906 RepID=A0A060DS11_9PROT|nr:hypothetical protein [Azospirillum argentinense]AIB15572.1 hypothetical protein ABAZ39_27270 [Azospirillum argentinense]EZQ03739.1 hypothetical protein ABAZ39_28950 [Azospirillum argentinense]PNQ96346.1 hypothetical protein C1S70_24235 [Azospirillum argentinense]